jgi:hypothetical protein
VRFLLLGFLISGFVGAAVAQCPVLPRHASIDPNGKTVAIRYYNSGTRAVQAVAFTLTKPEAGQNKPQVLARYSAKRLLHPKRERTVSFHNHLGESGLSGAAQVESLEVQVTSVAFTDQSTWTPPRDNPCKVSLSQH